MPRSMSRGTISEAMSQPSLQLSRINGRITAMLQPDGNRWLIEESTSRITSLDEKTQKKVTKENDDFKILISNLLFLTHKDFEETKNGFSGVSHKF